LGKLRPALIVSQAAQGEANGTEEVKPFIDCSHGLPRFLSSLRLTSGESPGNEIKLEMNVGEGPEKSGKGNRAKISQKKEL
jgi:hypothetical protein